MGKPSFNVYEQFRERYARINQKLGRKQYLVPYLMSSHPGATLDDAIMLAQYLNRIGYMPEQVQDFYPTPGTLSTAMYYTGIDPRTMKPVYVRENAGGKGDAACAAAMAPSGQASDHPCGAKKGRPRRSDRLRKGMPHPPEPRRRAERRSQKQQTGAPSRRFGGTTGKATPQRQTGSKARIPCAAAEKRLGKAEEEKVTGNISGTRPSNRTERRWIP